MHNSGVDTLLRICCTRMIGINRVQGVFRHGPNVFITAGRFPCEGLAAGAGDIVDGQYTVKFQAKDKAAFYLKPGNKAYENIRPKDSLELFGKVDGSARQYKYGQATVANLAGNLSESVASGQNL